MCLLRWPHVSRFSVTSHMYISHIRWKLTVHIPEMAVEPVAVVEVSRTLEIKFCHLDTSDWRTQHRVTSLLRWPNVSRCSVTSHMYIAHIRWKLTVHIAEMAVEPVVEVSRTFDPFLIYACCRRSTCILTRPSVASAKPPLPGLCYFVFSGPWTTSCYFKEAMTSSPSIREIHQRHNETRFQTLLSRSCSYAFYWTHCMTAA